jgi:hypothetical protein
VSIVDDKHERRCVVSQGRAQPQRAVSDARRRVGTGHRAAEEELPGLPGGTLDQPQTFGRRGVAKRRLEQ